MRLDRLLAAILILSPGFLPVISSPAHAAAGASDVGLTKLHAAHLELKGKTVHLWGGITGNATDYSFEADELTGDLSATAGKGSSVFTHAVFTGSADKHTQVIAKVRSVEQGYTQEIHADKGVYDVDPSGKTDGTMVFTGHVTMISKSSAILAAPGTTTFGRLKLVLGKGPDYPQIQGDSVDATFIPNKGSE